MKKFLQKTLALLVLCLVGMSAWAQETTFTHTFYSSGNYNYQTSDGNVTVANVGSAIYEGLGFNIYGTYGYVDVACEDGYEISRVELKDCKSSGYGATSDFGQYFEEVNSKGEMHDQGQWAYWTGAATSLRFGVGDEDFCVNTVTVYYHEAAPSTTFDFNYAYPASGTLAEAMTSGISVYHNYGTLSFAEGKSYSDITVNGIAVPYAAIYDGQVWISYNVTTEGTFVLTIPAGTFVNTAGKTNTEFTQTYTLTLPGFSISAAQWATFCMSKAWTMPTGYTGYVVSDIVDGSAILTETFAAGSVIPSYCPVLVNGPEANKVIVTTTSSWDSAPTNYLYSAASFGNNETLFTAGDMWLYMYILGEGNPCDAYLYKFSYDSEGENLGFYWDSADGQSLTCHPDRAFLVVPESKYTSSNSLKIRIADHTTGINGISTEGSNVIYNLQGQRVNTPTAGVYVKNGKKFIVK